MMNLTNISQSDKVKHRANRLKYRWIDTAKTGKCVLCKRDDIKIRNERYGLCLRCHKWCKKYLYRKYGYSHWSKFLEAIEYFMVPVKCQFYEWCGNETTRLKDNGEIRGDNKPWVCNSCRPMWEAGFVSGKHHITRVVKKGRTINNDFNK